MRRDFVASGGGPLACPCGSQLRPGFEVIDYLDQAALDGLAPSAEVQQWAPLLSWLLGTAVDVQTLCMQPPELPPSPTIDWFTDPIAAIGDLLQLVNAVRWPVLCECLPCPPISDCGQGTSFTVGTGSAYLEEGPSCAALKYHLIEADVFARVDGFPCCGPFHGDVFVQWNYAQDEQVPGTDSFGCGGVTDRTVSIDGSGAGETCTRVTGDTFPTVTFWVNGTSGPPEYPWPDLPVTVEPMPESPTCTETSQCEAIDYLGRTITELIWQTAVIGQRARETSENVQSINGPYTVDLPGLAEPITGSLSEVLPKLFTALAPPTQDQLTTEWTEIVTGNDTIDVSDLALLVCTLTTVPASFGSYGEAQEVYWATNVTPPPARVSLRTIDGVLSRHNIDNVGTTVIPIHPLVVHAAVDVRPGVEITISGMSRAV